MVHKVDVLIADDQLRARQSLRALLSTWPQAGAMLEASTGREALRVAEERQPGLVLMDARMPEMDGLQATLELKVKWPHIKVVVLSMYGDYEAEALAAGANAFVGKGEPPDRLLAVLTALISDVKDLPPVV
jgi:DNA-binding NarL/FixJ family response regulator